MDDTGKEGIDSLLGRMSPELIAGYEKRNLPAGVTLEGTIEEHNLAVEQIERITVQAFELWLMGILLIVAGAVVLWCLDVVSWFGAVLGAAVLLGIATGIFSLGEMRAKRFKKERDHAEQIFTQFRRSVENLTPFGMFVGEYTQVSIRDVLVSLAVTLIVVKKKLEMECKSETRRPPVVMQLGNWEQLVRGQFEARWRAAIAFGLAFDKEELFRDARNRLTR